MSTTRCTAFAGHRLIASGELRHVAMKAKQARDADPSQPVLVFEDRSGHCIDLPLEASDAELLRVLAGDPRTGPAVPAAGPRKPGRPKLGVTAREVTLLPRHWDWLAAQPGGASVALRRLVDEARRAHADQDSQRAAREATYRFLHAIAGDAPGYEAATRALFAGQRGSFEEAIADWPEDVATHATMLAAHAFDD